MVSEGLKGEGGNRKKTDRERGSVKEKGRERGQPGHRLSYSVKSK